MQDAHLLDQFMSPRGGSEEAFRTIVGPSHISMVYSVCLRQLRDPHWAEDVSQAVFILLAKKAGQLKPGVHPRRLAVSHRGFRVLQRAGQLKPHPHISRNSGGNSHE